MRKVRRFRASEKWQGEKNGLQISGYGLLCYLKIRELEGREAPTRNELVEALPVSKRTIDGMLAELREAGLLIART
jgi:DNA-binding IscR family transcriptional regulator